MTDSSARLRRPISAFMMVGALQMSYSPGEVLTRNNPRLVGPLHGLRPHQTTALDCLIATIAPLMAMASGVSLLIVLRRDSLRVMHRSEHDCIMQCAAEYVLHT
jgi:hypothetical protein